MLHTDDDRESDDANEETGDGESVGDYFQRRMNPHQHTVIKGTLPLSLSLSHDE